MSKCEVWLLFSQCVDPLRNRRAAYGLCLCVCGSQSTLCHTQITSTGNAICASNLSTQCHPHNMWSMLLADDPLSQFGRRIVAVYEGGSFQNQFWDQNPKKKSKKKVSPSAPPASRACVERTFKAADWASEGRHRLSFDKLAAEVSLRPRIASCPHQKMTAPTTMAFWYGEGGSIPHPAWNPTCEGG